MVRTVLFLFNGTEYPMKDVKLIAMPLRARKSNIHTFPNIGRAIALRGGIQ